MRSVCMMLFANMYRRKVQSLLIILTMMTSALLFSTSIGIFQNQHNAFEEMFEKQQGAHIVLDLNHKHTNLETLTLWWKNQEEIVDVVVYPYVMVAEKIRHQGHDLQMGSVMMTERVIHDYQTDHLIFIEGIQKDYPDEGEIFIPTGYASNWQINLNDEITIMLNGTPFLFRVAGIVVDPQYSATLTSPSRLWIKAGTLQTLYEADQLNQSLVGIRFHDYGDYEILMKRYEDDHGHPLFGFIYDYDFIRHMYTFIERIIAMIMLVFSCILLSVSMIVIVFTIHHGIRTDLKQIAILKTIGFHQRQIALLYVMQYVLLLCLALPFGLLISFGLIGLVFRQMAQSVGLSYVSINHLSLVVITSFVMLTLITLTALFSAQKAIKMKPIETLRYEIFQNVNHKIKLSLSTLRKLSLSFMLAIKSILSNLKHAIFIGVSVIVLAFVFTFSLNMYHSIKKMNSNLSMWGFDASEVFVTTSTPDDQMTHETFINTFMQHPDVKAVSVHGVMADASIASQDGISSTNALGFVYGGNWDGIGLTNIKGNHPVLLDEIAISYLTAQKYHKSVGDEIIIYVAGVKKTMIISGIYQSLNAGGWGFRVKAETVFQIDPTYDLPRYLIKLNHQKDTTQFIEAFNDEYMGIYIAKSVKDSGEINVDQIVMMMGLVAMTLSVVFMIISIIIVTNFMMIHILDHLKTFGIYKAIGMDRQTLKSSLNIKIIMLSLLGVMMGILLSIYFTPVLLSIFLNSMGLAKFPFEVNLLFTLCVIPLTLLIQLFSVEVASKKLKSIHLRELTLD